MKKTKKVQALLAALAFLFAAAMPALASASLPDTADSSAAAAAATEQIQSAGEVESRAAGNQWFGKTGTAQTRTYWAGRTTNPASLWTDTEKVTLPLGDRWNGADGGSTSVVSKHNSISSVLGLMHAEFEAAAYDTAVAQDPKNIEYAGFGYPTSNSTIEWTWSTTEPPIKFGKLGSDQSSKMDSWWKTATTVEQSLTSSGSGTYPSAVYEGATKKWLIQPPGSTTRNQFSSDWEATWNSWATNRSQSGALVTTFTGCEPDRALAWVWPMSAAYSNMLLNPTTTSAWPVSKDTKTPAAYVVARCSNKPDGSEGTNYTYYLFGVIVKSQTASVNSPTLPAYSSTSVKITVTAPPPGVTDPTYTIGTYDDKTGAFTPLKYLGQNATLTPDSSSTTDSGSTADTTTFTIGPSGSNSSVYEALSASAPGDYVIQASGTDYSLVLPLTSDTNKKATLTVTSGAIPIVAKTAYTLGSTVSASTPAVTGTNAAAAAPPYGNQWTIAKASESNPLPSPVSGMQSIGDTQILHVESDANVTAWNWKWSTKQPGTDSLSPTDGGNNTWWTQAVSIHSTPTSGSYNSTIAQAWLAKPWTDWTADERIKNEADWNAAWQTWAQGAADPAAADNSLAWIWPTSQTWSNLLLSPLDSNVPGYAWTTVNAPNYYVVARGTVNSGADTNYVYYCFEVTPKKGGQPTITSDPAAANNAVNMLFEDTLKLTANPAASDPVNPGTGQAYVWSIQAGSSGSSVPLTADNAASYGVALSGTHSENLTFTPNTATNEEISIASKVEFTCQLTSDEGTTKWTDPSAALTVNITNEKIAVTAISAGTGNPAAPATFTGLSSANTETAVTLQAKQTGSTPTEAPQGTWTVTAQAGSDASSEGEAVPVTLEDMIAQGTAASSNPLTLQPNGNVPSGTYTFTFTNNDKVSGSIPVVIEASKVTIQPNSVSVIVGQPTTDITAGLLQSGADMPTPFYNGAGTWTVQDGSGNTVSGFDFQETATAGTVVVQPGTNVLPGQYRLVYTLGSGEASEPGTATLTVTAVPQLGTDLTWSDAPPQFVNTREPLPLAVDWGKDAQGNALHAPLTTDGQITYTWSVNPSSGVLRVTQNTADPTRAVVAGLPAGVGKSAVVTVTASGKWEDSSKVTTRSLSAEITVLGNADVLTGSTTGVTGTTDIAPDSLPIGVTAGYDVTLAPDAYEDGGAPELSIEGSNVSWTITEATTDGNRTVGETVGKSVQVPTSAGLYTMTAVTTIDGQEQIYLFRVPVVGEVDAAPDGVTYIEDDGTFQLPSGTNKADVAATWSSDGATAPSLSAVEYVWQLVNPPANVALEPGGTSEAVGTNTWVASGEGADTATVSNISGTVGITLTPYAAGTYPTTARAGQQQAVPIGNTVTLALTVAGPGSLTVAQPQTSVSVEAGQNAVLKLPTLSGQTNAGMQTPTATWGMDQSATYSYDSETNTWTPEPATITLNDVQASRTLIVSLNSGGYTLLTENGASGQNVSFIYRIAVTTPMKLSYAPITMPSSQVTNGTSQPLWSPEPTVPVSYSISESTPAGGPQAQIDQSSGVVTVPAGSDLPAGEYTYTVTATPEGGQPVTAQVSVSVSAKIPAQNIKAPATTPSGQPGSAVDIVMPWDGEAPSDAATAYHATATGTDVPALSLTVGQSGATGTLIVPLDAAAGTEYVYEVVLSTGTESRLPVQLVVRVTGGTDSGVTLTATNTSIRVGTTVRLTAQLTGWEGTPTVTWKAKGCGDPQPEQESTEGSARSASFTPMQSGSMTVSVQVTSGDRNVTKSLTITVTDGSLPQPSYFPTNYPTQPVPTNPSPSVVPSGAPSATASASASASQQPSSAPSASPSGSGSGTLVPSPSSPVPVQITQMAGVSGTVVTGVPISTNRNLYEVAAFPSYVTVPQGCTVEIVTPELQPVPQSDPISTGQIVRVLDRDGVILSRATIIVSGDVLGTGELNIAQLVRLAQACTGERPLSGAYLAAGDFQHNNRIDISDVVREANMIVNMRAN